MTAIELKTNMVNFSKLLVCCYRELHEESGIMAEESNLTECGIINMDFPNGEIPFKIHVFRCSEYKGEILETEG
jgi:hypothetical protein